MSAFVAAVVAVGSVSTVSVPAGASSTCLFAPAGGATQESSTVVVGAGSPGGAASISGAGCALSSFEISFESIPLTGLSYDSVGLVRLGGSKSFTMHRNYQGGASELGQGVSYPCSPDQSLVGISGPNPPPRGQATSVSMKYDFGAKTVRVRALGAEWNWSDPSLPDVWFVSVVPAVFGAQATCGANAITAGAGTRIRLVSMAEGTVAPGPSVSGCVFGPTASGTQESQSTVIGVGSGAGSASLSGSCSLSVLEFSIENIPHTGLLYDSIGLVTAPGVAWTMHRNYQGGPSYQGQGVTYPCSPNSTPVGISGPNPPPRGQATTVTMRFEFATQTVRMRALGTEWAWQDTSLPTTWNVAGAPFTFAPRGQCGVNQLAPPGGSRVRLIDLVGSTVGPSGNEVLDARIARLPANAAGQRVYRVSLIVRNAANGVTYTFSSPTNHLPVAATTTAIASAGLATLPPYELVNPRGVFRASVNVGTQLVAQAEVK